MPTAIPFTSLHSFVSSTRSARAGRGCNHVGQLNWPRSATPLIGWPPPLPFVFPFSLQVPSEAHPRPPPPSGPVSHPPLNSRRALAARTERLDWPRTVAPLAPQLLFVRFVLMSLACPQSVPNLFIIIKLSKKRLRLTAAGVLSLRWIIHASRHRNESPGINLFTRLSLVLFRFGTAPAQAWWRNPSPSTLLFVRLSRKSKKSMGKQLHRGGAALRPSSLSADPRRC